MYVTKMRRHNHPHHITLSENKFLTQKNIPVLMRPPISLFWILVSQKSQKSNLTVMVPICKLWWTNRRQCQLKTSSTVSKSRNNVFISVWFLKGTIEGINIELYLQYIPIYHATFWGLNFCLIFGSHPISEIQTLCKQLARARPRLTGMPKSFSYKSQQIVPDSLEWYLSIYGKLIIIFFFTFFSVLLLSRQIS